MESICVHGEAKIGELQIECGGEINEQLWGAGATLAAYFLHAGPEGGQHLVADRPDVVELGSGTGITGLACACAGAGSMVLTDLQQGLARLEEAIEANAKPLEKAGAEVTAAALPWGDLDLIHEICPEGCDLIIGADLLYNPDNFDALLATLYELSQVSMKSIILKTRFGDPSKQNKRSGNTTRCRRAQRRGLRVTDDSQDSVNLVCFGLNFAPF